MLRIDGKKSADGTTMRKSKLMRKDRKETLGQVLVVHPLLKDAERVLLGLPPLPVSAVDAAAAAATTAAAATAAPAAAPVAAAAPAGGPCGAAGGGKGRKGKGRGPAAMPQARKPTAAAAKAAKAEAARIALMKGVSSEEEDSSDDEGYSALKRQRQAMAACRAGTSAADADA